jgi:hypothetical protein
MWRPKNSATGLHGGDSDALHEGDAVQVFSRSADKWVEGRVVELHVSSQQGKLALVEYAIGEDSCRKMMFLNSEHMVIPTESNDIGR